MRSLSERMARLTPAQRAVLEARMRTGAAQKITRLPHGTLAPASFGQNRLWFMERLVPGMRAYHGANLVRLRGPLDHDALASALKLAVQRHDSLRMRFE